MNITLDLARLLIDFGFVVLIWTVQLVIYPSFSYYSNSNLYTWHRRYTLKVTFIVLPLMFSQLILGGIQLWRIQNWYTISSGFIILILWLLTLVIFVPLHQSIDLNKPIENVCKKLVERNWLRTFLWTLLFVISFIYYSINL